MEQIRFEDPRHKKIVELVKNSYQLSYKYVESRYKKWEEADQMDRSFIDELIAIGFKRVYSASASDFIKHLLSE